MIELKFTGRCENCPNADIVLESNSTTRGVYWYLICKHADVCRYWEEKFQDKGKENE